MICSEKEAVGKFCPHMRVVQATYVDNRDPCNVHINQAGSYYFHNCIASRCMMWVPVKGGRGDGRCGLSNEQDE